jgi:hypothetical protein
LLDLVWFRESVPRLQVQDLAHPDVSEDVVTPFDALGKAQAQQERPQFSKTNVDIRIAAKYSEQG